MYYKNCISLFFFKSNKLLNSIIRRYFIKSRKSVLLLLLMLLIIKARTRLSILNFIKIKLIILKSFILIYYFLIYSNFRSFLYYF